MLPVSQMITTQLTNNNFLQIDDETSHRLIAGAVDSQRVVGLTHNFYRYPARFSPVFARSVINAFTKPGDFVFDPFMGGGTTLVEATVAGRRAAGTDISSLAAFVTQVKTTPLKNNDLDALSKWADELVSKLNIHRNVCYNSDYDQRYKRNLYSRETWRIKKLIEQAIATTPKLHFIKRRDFARCAILRTSQWALDGRKRIPSASQFRSRLVDTAHEMVEASRSYSREVRLQFGDDSQREIVECFHSATEKLDFASIVDKFGAPKLVLTSPPYPGVRVLYHRWQVNGRRETPAPFWIANKLDSAGASYYTMGYQKQRGLTTYYSNIGSSFAALRPQLSKSSVVVQMVAFSDPSWQLRQYLNTMNNAGFVELKLPQLTDVKDGRLWRKVPNRKWHAHQKGPTNGSREVMLFHRPEAD